jgi:hypothetical protein
MKKWILILCLFVLAVTGAFYFFIPATQTFTRETTISCTESAANRIMLNSDRWLSWWPGQKKDNNLYSYKNFNYRIGKIFINGIEATIFNDNDSTKGILQVIGSGTDSAQLSWTSTFAFSTNPVKRLLRYNRSINIKNNIESLLADIKKHFDKEENIYGMKVVKQKVTEASMIAVKQIFTHDPSTQEIYSMIDSLKGYIIKKGGEENDYPMLNIHIENSNTYDAMTAIPTKSDLPSEGNFHLKKMVLGNILMAEIRGGVYTIKKGEQELKNYASDYKKTAPAIPFQLLVTNRLLETDTSKWVTRLYYPIF